MFTVLMVVDRSCNPSVMVSSTSVRGANVERERPVAADRAEVATALGLVAVGVLVEPSAFGEVGAVGEVAAAAP